MESVKDKIAQLMKEYNAELTELNYQIRSKEINQAEYNRKFAYLNGLRDGKCSVYKDIYSNTS